MSRLSVIRPAQRPKMSARALIQGPQGSGKTWTALSIARSFTAGTEGRILGIDTERESMLTYADVFTFEHLPWRPPYSPDELTQTLDQIASTWVQSPDDVVVIDSMAHFWRGSGGILDVAGGKVQGGWDRARPMQQALVEQILAMPCHVLLCVRMKNTVLVSDGGKSIENVGLTITQDEELGYELNIVVQMDMGHNIAVMKSRTPAVPVGRQYPGGSEGKLAADYAEWLAGGIPPANRDDVEAIVGVFAGITDRERRKVLKEGFVEEFGMPHSLTAEQVPAARQWLADQGAAIGEGPAASHGVADGAQEPQDDPNADPGPDAPEEGDEGAEGHAAEEPAEPTAEDQQAAMEAEFRATLEAAVVKLAAAEVRAQLDEDGQNSVGRIDTIRRRLTVWRWWQAGVCSDAAATALGLTIPDPPEVAADEEADQAAEDAAQADASAAEQADAAQAHAEDQAAGDAAADAAAADADAAGQAEAEQGPE